MNLPLVYYYFLTFCTLYFLVSHRTSKYLDIIVKARKRGANIFVYCVLCPMVAVNNRSPHPHRPLKQQQYHSHSIDSCAKTRSSVSILPIIKANKHIITEYNGTVSVKYVLWRMGGVIARQGVSSVMFFHMACDDQCYLILRMVAWTFAIWAASRFVLVSLLCWCGLVLLCMVACIMLEMCHGRNELFHVSCHLISHQPTPQFPNEQLSEN